jgi:hypothetical protein
VSAADLLVKKPISEAAVYTWNWTGFYVGGALGGKWANTTWTTTSTSDFPGTIVDDQHEHRDGQLGLQVRRPPLREILIAGGCHDATLRPRATASRSGSIDGRTIVDAV